MEDVGCEAETRDSRGERGRKRTQEVVQDGATGELVALDAVERTDPGTSTLADIRGRLRAGTKRVDMLYICLARIR